VFANNRLSVYLRSSRGEADLIGLFTDDFRNSMTGVVEGILDPQDGHSYESSKSPFMLAARRTEKIDGNVYDWYKAHPERQKRFGRAMVGWSGVTDSANIADSTLEPLLPSTVLTGLFIRVSVGKASAWNYLLRYWIRRRNHSDPTGQALPTNELHVARPPERDRAG